MTPAPSADSSQHFALTGDCALGITFDARVAGSVREWLPESARRSHRLSTATITVEGGAPESNAAFHAWDHALIGIGPIRLYPASARRLSLLATNGAPVGGTLDLGGLHAAIHFGGSDANDIGALHCAITLAAALLLVRLGRTLVHAAAVVDPEGGAWILAGDPRTGKTSTCASLVDAGWEYLSDDHVVLYRESGDDAAPVWVEGWPRHFHLDAGWEARRPSVERISIDARSRWPGAWRGHAPVAGVLLPRVHAAGRTRVRGAPAAAALAALIRQSPWLAVDGAGAGETLSLLAATASIDPRQLDLCDDGFGNGSLLASLLTPVTVAAGMNHGRPCGRP